MPFIGRELRPKKQPDPEKCPTPRWTFFIRSGSLWMCPHCAAIYRLDKGEITMNISYADWIKIDG